MKKKEYTGLDLEVIQIDNCDVITTSCFDCADCFDCYMDGVAPCDLNCVA